MGKVLVKNVADPDQVKRAEREVNLKSRDSRDDIIWILSTTQGRRFLWKVLEQCGVYRNAMTGSSQTFFNLGQQSIGQSLLAEITAASPEAWVQMMKENKPDGWEDNDVKEKAK